MEKEEKTDMVTIILPGYSSSNREWLEAMAKGIGGDSEIRPIYWAHWSDPLKKFDPKSKADLLDGISGKRVVNIIAKSIGTLAASYLIQKSPQKIGKVIFCGIPLGNLNEENKEVIKNALKKIPPSNFICFQNDEDPYGGIDSVRSLISEFGNNLKVVKKQRSDHEYFYLEDFKRFLLD